MEVVWFDLLERDLKGPPVLAGHLGLEKMQETKR